MTPIPCAVCGEERCRKDCCYRCQTEAGCKCEEIVKRKFEGVESWMLELELYRREEVRKANRRESLLKKKAEIEEQLAELDNE